MSAERDPPVPEPDEFDRLLMELTSGQARPAKFREPSAAERARIAAQARRSGLASGDRTSRPARRRALARATSVLVLIALLGYGAYALRLHHPFPSSPAAGGSPAASPPAPAPTPSGQASPLFTLADPFAGTTAEKFPSGPAGIVVPAPATAGSYTAAQVADAYASTRKLLIAAELDRPTLRGEPPRAFSRLLTPEQRARFQRGLNLRGVDKHGYARSTRSWVTSFAPGTALVGGVIKVTGLMSARPASDGGSQVLRVLVNYLFVYPVERPAEPATRIRVVVHLTGDVDFAQWDSSGSPLQAWWLASADSAGARCDIHDGYVHPEFPGSASPDKVRPSGPPIDPYQLQRASTHLACQATTGT